MERDSYSSLLCLDEDVGDEDDFISFKSVAPSDAEDDEYVQLLVDREMRFGFKTNHSFLILNPDKIARLDAVAWILRVSSFLPFSNAVCCVRLISLCDKFI